MPLQVRQAEQLVEPAEQAEMGEALAQPVPAQLVRRGGAGRRDLLQVGEIHLDRNVRDDALQRRQRSGSRSRLRYSSLRYSSFGSFGLRRLRLSLGFRPPPGGIADAGNLIQPFAQPLRQGHPGGKRAHRTVVCREAVAPEQLGRRRTALLQIQQQGLEKGIGRPRHIALPHALQEQLRPVGPPLDQRRGGREGQQFIVAGAFPHRLLGDVQRRRVAILEGRADFHRPTIRRP